MKKSNLIFAIVCIIGMCNVMHAQEMKFLGIPFGTESTIFNHKLMDKGYKWVTATGSSTTRRYKAELEGDFWRIRNCTIFLFSYSCDDSKTACPITEAWVILPTEDGHTSLYAELISDFVKKYGDYTEVKSISDDTQTEWHLSNGNIIVEELMTFAIRIRYLSSIRLRQLEEANRFRGNGSNDL